MNISRYLFPSCPKAVGDSLHIDLSLQPHWLLWLLLVIRLRMDMPPLMMLVMMMSHPHSVPLPELLQVSVQLLVCRLVGRWILTKSHSAAASQFRWSGRLRNQHLRYGHNAVGRRRRQYRRTRIRRVVAVRRQAQLNRLLWWLFAVVVKVYPQRRWHRRWHRRR